MTGFMFPLWLQVGLLLAAIELFAGLCLLFLRRPTSAFMVVLATFVTQVYMVQPPSVSFVVTLYLPDVVFSALLVVVVVRMLLGQGVVPAQYIGMCLFGVLLLSLFRGISIFGLQAAMNEARPYFYFSVGTLFFAGLTLTDRDIDRLVDGWLKTAYVIAFSAIFYWLAMFAQLPITAPWSREAVGWGNSPLRVLSVAQAMFLTSALFVSLGMRLSGVGSLWQKRLPILLLPVLLLLTHRTVWIITLVGLASFLIITGTMRGRYVKQLAAVVGGLGILALFTLQGGSDEVTTSLQKSSTNYSTFEWRIESWRLLLNQDENSGMLDRLFGHPSGAGFDRIIFDEIVSVQPHNFYVQTLVALGIVGLIVLVALYVQAILRARKATNESPQLRGSVMVVVLLGQMLYFITYGADLEFGIVVGVALGMATRPRTVSRGVQKTWVALASPS